MAENIEEGLLTLGEAARLLNVHDNTIRRWSNRGLIKFYRVGSRGDRRFKLSDIEQFLGEYNEIYES
jgi:excisionase family DNA binding protein